MPRATQKTQRILSVDEEKELADRIAAGRDLILRNKDELTPEENRIRQDAIRARDTLVFSYAPLIESIAKDFFYRSHTYSGEVEDFINEAYVVAFQCGRTFNPYKGKRITRFSSYVSLAIKSSLHRMSMKSRSSVSVPSSAMRDARKWSHVLFDMKSSGIAATDEQISHISGVTSSQDDVRRILQLSNQEEIGDDYHPHIYDGNYNGDIADMIDDIRRAFREIFGLSSPVIEYILGLTTGRVCVTAWDLSSASGIKYNDAETIMDWFHEVFTNSYIRHTIHNSLK